MVCRTHYSEAFFGGAGECPLAVPFQNAFGESLGNRAAVERDERAARPLAVGVNKAGGDLLAATRFPEEQYRDVGACRDT